MQLHVSPPHLAIATHSIIRFSLSDSFEVVVEALLTFLGGFSFFSGLPSFNVSVLSADLVRFFADAELVTGDDTSVSAAALGAGASITVDRKSRASTWPLSTYIVSGLGTRLTLDW